jgi:hypothetical protein
MRTPWQPGLNASLFKNIYPWENHKRSAQFRFEAFNALNHTWFTTNPNSSMNIFTGQPNRTFTGRIPYMIGLNPSSFPVGTREYYVAQRYNANFGVFNMGNNNPGRTVSHWPQAELVNSETCRPGLCHRALRDPGSDCQLARRLTKEHALTQMLRTFP